MRIKVVPLRDPAKVRRCLGACHPLWDRARAGLRPGDFWREGTYHPGPLFVNCWLVVLRPTAEALADLDGPVGLGREAAWLLERRKGVVLDWCAGLRRAAGRESVWLFAKPRAADAATGKEARVRLDKDDIAALAALLGREGGGRKRARDRERRRERER